jgi:hypothetical protein
MEKEERSTMKSAVSLTKRYGVLCALILSVTIILSSAPVIGQGTETSVTGAAGASFPDGAIFNGIPLSGLELGQGIFVAPDGTAQGEFHVVLLGKSLLGLPQEIVVDGKVSNGSVTSDGRANVSGIATVDLGDGTPLPGVPFTVTLSADSVVLTIGSTILPAAGLTSGAITIE